MSKPAHETNLAYAEVDLGAKSDFRMTRADDGSIRFTGNCPRCHGETTMSFAVVRGDRLGSAQKALRRLAQRRSEPALSKPATMYCECGAGHQRPTTASDAGCGAYWTVTP